jgi:AcrR family transcriptional regulator
MAASMMPLRRDGRWAGRAVEFEALAMVHPVLSLTQRRSLACGTRQNGVVPKVPAHRPSRRDEIVDAAIGVFARKGFVDTSISDIAEVVDVAVTAVYYHFAGKDDLYGAAIGRVLSSVDEVVSRVRRDGGPVEIDSLHRVIDAVWEWVDANPEPATLMHLHTPSATRQAVELRREFDDLHVRRAFDYVAPGTEKSPQRQAVASIAVKTLVDALIAIHPMRMPGGPLSDCSPHELRNAVKALSTRLVSAV